MDSKKLAGYFSKPGRQTSVGNRKPLVFVFILFTLVAVAFGVTLSGRMAQKRHAVEIADQKPEPVDMRTLFGDETEQVAMPETPIEEDLGIKPLEMPVMTPLPPMNDYPEPNPLDLQAEDEEKAARQSSITAYTNPEFKDLLPTVQKPETLQAQIKKSQILSENYLQSGRIPQLSPYEIKAGAVIPAIMISGIASDLPGQITAQVAQNVYDTATGTHLMIPQGSRIIGNYSNEVNTGQERVMVAWQRIVFPDGSSLSLGGMQGMDQAGYTGFKDKTNKHTKATFGQAVLLSLFSAGAQLAQPIPKASSLAYSPQQVAAGAVSQQVAQYGMASMNRGMQIPPTITIRPGYRFNIMVNKDIAMEPWQANAHHLQAIR